MINPLGVSPSKGYQGATRGKEKIFFFSLPRVAPWYPLLGLTPSGLFMGSISTLIYTSVILCSTICVHSATRLNKLGGEVSIFNWMRTIKSRKPVFITKRDTKRAEQY